MSRARRCERQARRRTLAPIVLREPAEMKLGKPGEKKAGSPWESEGCGKVEQAGLIRHGQEEISNLTTAFEGS